MKATNSPENERELPSAETKTRASWVYWAVAILMTAVFIGGIVVYETYLADQQPPPVSGEIRPFSLPKDALMVDMAFVPVGTFVMGNQNPSEYVSGDEAPAHDMYLRAFWIDKTEVTNRQFAVFVDATDYETTAQQVGDAWVYDPDSAELYTLAAGADWQHPYGPGSELSELELHPVVNVSWYDAEAFCKWRDARLPTEAEWEKAARWDAALEEARVYPWGDEWDSRISNIIGTDDGFAGTAPVGSFPEGASPYNVLDMSGNVWEWVFDRYHSTIYEWGTPRNRKLRPKRESNDPYAEEQFSGHVLRGGSWNIVVERARSSNRYWYVPQNSYNTVGFRCALDY